jgi:hypothetical protein
MKALKKNMTILGNRAGEIRGECRKLNTGNTTVFLDD